LMQRLHSMIIITAKNNCFCCCYHSALFVFVDLMVFVSRFCKNEINFSSVREMRPAKNNCQQSLPRAFSQSCTGNQWKQLYHAYIEKTRIICWYFRNVVEPSMEKTDIQHVFCCAICRHKPKLLPAFMQSCRFYASIMPSVRFQ